MAVAVERCHAVSTAYCIVCRRIITVRLCVHSIACWEEGDRRAEQRGMSRGGLDVDHLRVPAWGNELLIVTSPAASSNVSSSCASEGFHS